MVSELILSLTRLLVIALTPYSVIINTDLHDNNDTRLIAFNASSQLSLKLTP